MTGYTPESFEKELKGLGFTVFKATVCHIGDAVELETDPEDFIKILTYTGCMMDAVYRNSFKMGKRRHTTYHALLTPGVVLYTKIREETG